MQEKLKKRYLRLGIILLILIMASFVVSFLLENNKNAEIKKAYSLLDDGKKAVDENNILDAFSTLQQAITSFKELDVEEGLFEAVVYQSLVYNIIGQNDQAYEILKSVKYRELADENMYSSLYYLRLMSYYCALIDKNYKSSEFYVRKAINLSKEKLPNDTAIVYIDMANLAELYIMSDKYSRAKEILDSIKYLKPIQNKRFLSEYYYCMGRLHEKNEMKDSAYISYIKSLQYSNYYSTFDNALAVLGMLVKIDSVNGNLSSYIKHMNELDDLKEKLKGSEVYYKIAVMQEQHKTELILRENKKDKTIYTLAIFTILIAIILLLIVFIYYRSNMKSKQKLAALEKERLDAVIEMEKHEKELMQLKMNKKDEMLDKAYKENIAISLKVGDKNEVRTLDSFEKVMKDMDSNFLKKVETLYPTLSLNDIRLMCFIRLGMTTQEISSVLNISVDSLYKSRYRLRKKLGIDNDKALATFINSLD